jgi:hypothetical protein
MRVSFILKIVLEASFFIQNQSFMRYLMELDNINFEHPILFIKEVIFQFFEWQNINIIS